MPVRSTRLLAAVVAAAIVGTMGTATAAVWMIPSAGTHAGESARR